MSENILVIGACGQLGTELVESLRTIYGDSNVVASDIRQSEHAVFKQGPFVNLDILDKRHRLQNGDIGMDNVKVKPKLI